MRASLFIYLFPFVLMGHLPDEGNAKCIGSYDSTRQMYVYTQVDKMPEYPDSLGDFITSFAKEYKCPVTETLPGRLEMKFIVDADGAIIFPEARFSLQKDDNLWELEALRVIKQMPNWQPGECNGEKVPVEYRMPIHICVR